MEELCAFGRAITGQRLEALMAEVDGVRRGEDPECVHRMRVASRRLRSALRIFNDCFKGKRGRRWRKAVKEVTTLLGEARDLDVQIGFLTSISKERGGEEAAGLALIIERLKCRRASLQPEIAWVMDSLTEGPMGELLYEFKEVREWKGDGERLRPYAFAHASAAVEELMDRSRSVTLYEDWQGHHALRIAGKHLRYALEAFRGAYEDRLEEELRTLKGLQDVLGELHDCDVWIQRLPGLREEVPQAAKAIDLLESILHPRRRALHEKLVDIWCGLQQERFFQRLLGKLQARQPMDQCPVRLALISDVHGNADALQAVISHARRGGVTAFLNAGDSIGPPKPRETVEMIRGQDILSVSGNMDRALLRNTPGKKVKGKKVKDRQLKMTLELLDQDDIAWLRSLPEELRLDVCGRTVLVTHASPGQEAEKLLPFTPESRMRFLARTAKADVIVTGHSHLPMVREIGGVLFINPGSVGRPRDGAQACYALLDLPSMEVVMARVTYDSRRTAEEMRALGFNDVSKEIEEGRCWDAVSEVRDWVRRFEIDHEHAEQVRTVATLIFDRTRGLHRLDSKDRELLEMAALVHDVGLTEGTEGHQRKALDIIMGSGLCLGEAQRRMLACVARYHGMRSPRKQDRVFRDLSGSERGRVIKLSAILSLADGLDRSHSSLVGGLDVSVDKERVLIRLHGERDLSLEKEWGARKSAQFRRAFRREVRIVD